MPLFLSDEELGDLRHDGIAVAAKADSYIRELYAQLKTLEAQADAASITAEQTSSQLEHNYLSLSSDYSDLESRFSELEIKLQATVSDLDQVQPEKHQLHVKAIENDGEIERMSELMRDLSMAKEEIERLRLESQANKDHMTQYKNIAEVNEVEFKQMESSFELYRNEAENKKNLFKEEVSSLRERILQLENKSSLRSEELESSQLEIAKLKDEISTKISQTALMEVQINSLQANCQEERQKGLTVRENYRRHDELKAKRDTEKSEIEKCKSEAEKKYNEVNEQFENALKSEAAQALLSEQRNLVSSERTLQLQFSHMNLLRESINQLTEENKYNFEECQELREIAQKERAEAESLRNLLKENEMLVEALRKESNSEKESSQKRISELLEKIKNIDMEKESSQKRISELLEKIKNIDMEECTQMKSDNQEMKVKMQEKERELEKSRSLLSEKEKIISKLEHELAGARNNSVEKDSTISRWEAIYKNEVEKQITAHRDYCLAGTGEAQASPARKRLAASSVSDRHDESLQQAPIGSDTVRGLKRTKAMEPPQEDTLENVETQAAADSEDVHHVDDGIPEDVQDDAESSQGQ